MMHKHDTTKYTCELCGKSVQGRYSFLRHQRYQHDKFNQGPRAKRECKKCKQEFQTLKELVDHQNTAHPEVCPICHNTFNQLKTHMKVVHEVSKRFICEVCGAEMKYKGSYKKHMKKYHDVEVTQYLPFVRS